MRRPYEFTAVFRNPTGLEVPSMLNEIYELLPELRACSPMLDTWLLKGNTKSEAFLYNVFGPTGATVSATAVLTESLKREVDPRIVSMWNGREGSEGASLQYVGRPAPETSTVILRAKPDVFAPEWTLAADLIKKAVSQWHPTAVNIPPVPI